jgi:hypothetical protein
MPTKPRNIASAFGHVTLQHGARWRKSEPHGDLARLVPLYSGRVAQPDQLSEWESLFLERAVGNSVDDQHLAAENTANCEAVTLNGDYSVLFVVDCHL